MIIFCIFFNIQLCLIQSNGCVGFKSLISLVGARGCRFFCVCLLFWYTEQQGGICLPIIPPLHHSLLGQKPPRILSISSFIWLLFSTAVPVIFQFRPAILSLVFLLLAFAHTASILRLFSPHLVTLLLNHMPRVFPL